MPVTLDASVLMTELGVDATQASRLLSVASAIATNYASAAPDAILDESVLRIAGWLYQQPMGSIKSEAAGPLRIAYNSEQKSALRHSGAQALLSPYKVRRASAIG